MVERATLTALQRGPSTGCVAALEEMLTLAKSGEITSVAIAAIDVRGGCYRKTRSDASKDGLLALTGATRMLCRMVEDQLVEIWGE
jgi:hypothetical protein